MVHMCSFDVALAMPLLCLRQAMAGRTMSPHQIDPQVACESTTAPVQLKDGRHVAKKPCCDLINRGSSVQMLTESVTLSQQLKLHTLTAIILPVL